MVIYKKPFSIETGYNDFILLLIYKKIPQLYPRFSPTSISEGLLIESLSFVKGYPSCLQSPSSLALYPTLSMTCPQETLSQSPGSVHQTLIVTPQCPPPHNALLPYVSPSGFLGLQHTPLSYLVGSLSLPPAVFLPSSLLRTSSSLLFTTATHPLSVTCYRLLMSVSYSILWNLHGS